MWCFKCLDKEKGEKGYANYWRNCRGKIGKKGTAGENSNQRYSEHRDQGELDRNAPGESKVVPMDL